MRIQTEEMHEYVSKRKFSSWIQDQMTDIYRVLGSLRTAHFEEHQFLRDLRETVLQERINVFTNSGDIVTIPQHATGVDFAFAVNPDHLSYLQAIRVNGNLREATYPLHEGDVIELVLAKSNGGNIPTLWIEKVKSVDAREQMRASLGQTPMEEQILAGSQISTKSCRKENCRVGGCFV